MANWNTLPAEVMERIITLAQHFNSVEIAQILQCSESTARKVTLAYNTAKEKDVNRLREIQVSEPVRLWAAEKFSIDLSEPPQEPPKEEPKEEPKDNTAEAFLKLLTALGEIRKDLSRLCGALTNLDNDFKAQHTAMVDVVNANADMIHGSLKEQKDILNGIKANTRPRRSCETV